MKGKYFGILIFAAAIALAGCKCDDMNTKPEPMAEHIVYIGLDGWGAYSLPEADMPTVTSLMDQGCWTLQKRTVLPSSSAPNWASMFMGAGPELHGYTTWGSKKPELPSRVILKNDIFPTIFQVARDEYPEAEIGVLCGYPDSNYFTRNFHRFHGVTPLEYRRNPSISSRLPEGKGGGMEPVDLHREADQNPGGGE